MVWEHHDDPRETMVRDWSHAVISSPGIRSGCWGLSPPVVQGSVPMLPDGRCETMVRDTASACSALSA